MKTNCEYCGGAHVGVCPRIKKIEYVTGPEAGAGTHEIRSIEFHPPMIHTGPVGINGQEFKPLPWADFAPKQA